VAEFQIIGKIQVGKGGDYVAKDQEGKKCQKDHREEMMCEEITYHFD
jgi:hypothetical protein